MIINFCFHENMFGRIKILIMKPPLEGGYSFSHAIIKESTEKNGVEKLINSF